MLQVIISYWLVAGIIVQLLFNYLYKIKPVNFSAAKVNTLVLRNFFYMCMGGVLLPMLCVLTVPIVIGALAASTLIDKVLLAVSKK